MKPATRLALQDAAKSCQSPRARWRPVSGVPFGAALPTHSSVPAGGCCSTYFPKGLIGLRAAGSCFPRAPLGGEHPQHNRPAAGSRAAGPRGLLPQRLGPGRAFCLRGSRAAAWAGASAHAGNCARVCVCACQRARACVHRSWGRGGGGSLLFARLFPNMAPLLRTQEKKIQWFYQNKLLLVPEITFLNVELVPTPGRSGRKTAFFKLLAAEGLARAPFC